MWLRFDSTLYINKRVAKKLYKRYTNPTFNPTSRWFSVSCEMYSLCFKLYTNYTLNYTLRRFKPYTASVQNLHSERSRNYTRSGTQTLHFVFEHESREWNLEREWSGWNLEHGWSGWSESYVTFVTNVTKATNVTNVTNVKQEMAIGGDALRHSYAPRQKIQQFWVIFRWFDINIFNLSEHFPPPNFSYSARSFPLPSPNLN